MPAFAARYGRRNLHAGWQGVARKWQLVHLANRKTKSSCTLVEDRRTRAAAGCGTHRAISSDYWLEPIF